MPATKAQTAANRSNGHARAARNHFTRAARFMAQARAWKGTGDVSLVVTYSRLARCECRLGRQRSQFSEAR